jgi:DNA-binding response OmpR family regulator
MSGESRPRILVVEDDESLARFLELELKHQGYETAVATGGYEALVKAMEGNWDLVILDIMLPGLDGFEICRRLRENSSVPVIMLTARGTVPDRVKGLDTGADDYLVKPFATEELLARIRACLRRQNVPLQACRKIVYGDLTVNLDTRQVERGGRKITLSKKEFDLLVYLLANAGHVLSREAILNHVWGYDYFGDTNVVDVYIRYLRAKIDEPFATRLLHTVRGVGYTLREEK